MNILLTDESNRDPGHASRFFIYGGLVLRSEALSVIHTEVSSIRQAAGYGPSDQLKFETRARPARVPIEVATDAKRKIIALAQETDCKFIVHVILHDIIANQDRDQQICWAADYVISRFNRYLEEKGEDGICVVDRFPSNAEFGYLADKFSHGLTLGAARTVPLDRIKLFASTCLGASHANSVMDIVLGAFRYCINNPKNPDAAREMFGSVVQMMWGRRIGGTTNVRDRGLILRPAIRDIWCVAYREEYKSLIRSLRRLLTDKE